MEPSGKHNKIQMQVIWMHLRLWKNTPNASAQTHRLGNCKESYKEKKESKL